MDNIHTKALEFRNKYSNKISKMNIDENQRQAIDALETAFPFKMPRKQKRMADKPIDDEGNTTDYLADIRINVFNLIMDRIVQFTTTTPC